MKLRKPRITATIWSSGKVICTGATRWVHDDSSSSYKFWCILKYNVVNEEDGKRQYLPLLGFTHTGSHVDPCQATYLGRSVLCEVTVSDWIEILSNISSAFWESGRENHFMKKILEISFENSLRILVLARTWNLGRDELFWGISHTISQKLTWI